MASQLHKEFAVAPSGCSTYDWTLSYYLEGVVAWVVPRDKLLV